MRKSLYQFCIEQGRSRLLSEWDSEQNSGISPESVSYGSHKTVWWKCEKGHLWQARISARSAGADCPYCKNRLLLSGYNDLKSRYPELARQWHLQKNGPLRPDGIFAHSRRKVWWQCEKGHIYQASIQSRANGSGCPVCAGKQVVPGEGDLASRYPNIAKEWHPRKNGTLRPEAVSPYSNRRVWWICPEGHEYAAVIARRTAGLTGCPVCAGRKVLPGYNDLLTREPELSKQWHPDLNGSLTPRMLTPGSHKMVWWRCSEGHVWKATVYSRTGAQRSGCPVCAGRVKKARLERYERLLEKTGELDA